jgi:predicted nuclease of predicted toxin-antitoxin system
MKIKLDENLPHGLAVVLNDFGHDTQTVHDEDLTGSEDSIIWNAVKREGRFLVT